MTESTTPRTDEFARIPSKDQSIRGICADWAEFARGLERESASRLEALEQQAQRIAKLESDVGAARGALSEGSSFAEGFRAARKAASAIVVSFTDGDDPFDGTLAHIAVEIDQLMPGAPK